MTIWSPPNLLRYGGAVVAVLLATAVRVALDPILRDLFPFSTMFLAVLVVAAYAGRGPALLTVVLGAAALARFLLPPRDSFAIEGLANQAGFVLYLIVGVGIALLGGALREARERAERKSADAARQREELRITLDSIGDGVLVTDTEGRVRSMNRVAEALTGWPSSEAVGQPILSVFRIVDEETREPVDNPGLQALSEGVVVGLANPTILIARDGTERPIDDSAAPIRDEQGQVFGVVLTFRDVTEQRQNQRVMREHAETLSGILDATVDHIYVLDQAGRYRHISAGGARVLGFEPAAMAGKHWGELGLPADIMQTFDAQREQVLRSGQPAWHESRHVSPTGVVSDFEYTIAPVRVANRQVDSVVVVSRDVTKHKIAEQERLNLLKELETQNAFIKAVLSQVPAAIVVADAASGRILMSNYEAHRIVQHEYEAGRTLDDYGTTYILQAFRPDGSRYGSGDWPLVRAQGGETVVGEEMELVLRDRSRVTIRVNAGPIRAGEEVVAAVVAYHDISDRKATEQAARFLADASASLASLVDYEATLRTVANLAVPTFADWAVVDMAEADGSIKRLAVAHADPSKDHLAFEVHRRYPADPKAPHGPANVLRTGRSEFIHEYPDEMLVTGASNEEHLRLLRELGLKSYICVPLRVRGETLGVLGFASAESGRLYNEHDLAVAEDLASRAAIAIENARLYSELKEADRIKNEFLATLAHELRNPLAPIRTALRLMREPSTNGESNEADRAMAERQVVHLTRLIDDLMDVARISRGKIDLHKKVVDLATIVNQAVETSRPLIDDRGHHLIVTLPAEVIRLEADPTRLEQVLWNLLNNAAKYSDPGCRIELVVDLEGCEVVVRVKDTGIGINPEMLPRIFGMFVQVGDHKDHARGGLGIGLSLVRTLVEMHGGSIVARSDGPGLGSEFIVRLPVLTTIPINGEPSKVPETRQDSALACRRILVVDDNQDAAKSLARLLTRLYGQVVRVVHDGPSALVAAEEFRPEVILLDIGLPGMSGHDVARAIRGWPWGRDVVIIALTGWGQEEDRRRSEDAGFNDHLVKPVDPADLETILADLPPRPAASPHRVSHGQ